MSLSWESYKSLLKVSFTRLLWEHFTRGWKRHTKFWIWKLWNQPEWFCKHTSLLWYFVCMGLFDKFSTTINFMSVTNEIFHDCWIYKHWHLQLLVDWLQLIVISTNSLIVFVYFWLSIRNEVLLNITIFQTNKCLSPSMLT